MSKIIIGIDPDSKAHGVAVYNPSGLLMLHSMTLVQVFGYVLDGKKQGFEFEAHIENVCGMSAVFRQRQKTNQAVNMKMSNSVGKCQQSQIELERLLEWLEVKVIKHRISKMWKKDKKQFEKVTGWTGRSNEDTRSAAYFGWLGTKS